MSEREYVGIDLHRRRSVIVRVDKDGHHLSTKKVYNEPVEVMAAVSEAGEQPVVVLEATFGYYWLVDLLVDHRGGDPPGQRLNWGNRRVKNDERDALDLVRKLRLGELPEAWIPPPRIRELRELVRYRAKTVRLRSGLKAQVHAVMAKNGVLPCRGDMFGPGGQAQLDSLGPELPMNYVTRIESLRDLIELYDREVAMLERDIHRQLKDDPGYKAIQKIPGIGPTIAAIFVAEIGDVTRFSSPQKLCSWAGLTPKHFESDTKVIRGRVTKQGSRLVRWAAIEAVSKNHCKPPLKGNYERIAERRGKQKARTAVARKLLIYVYYGLRDGVIHSLRADEHAA